MTETHPLFVRYLSESFSALPSSVRAAHLVVDELRLAGRSSVKRGSSAWARILAALFRFPPVSSDVAVEVVMTAKDGGELWERRFGDRRFSSFLKVKQGKMTERFGPFTFTLGLHVAHSQLCFPVNAGRVGPIPFPKFLLPLSIAREFESDGRFHLDVELRAPVTGALIVHYQGWLEPEALSLSD